MKRRDFLATGLAAPLASLSGSPGLQTREGAGLQTREGAGLQAREYYELRLYHLRVGPQERQFTEFLRDVAIPAWNRAGIAPVGVFNVLFGADRPTAYVLLPHTSGESVLASGARLSADAEYQKRAAAVLGSPAASPAYVRAESSLMVAFETIPKLEVPAGAADRKPRIFELRTYESPTETGGLKKIEMFNTGEIAIFRRTGLAPVFFGQTLIGPRLPNLTYLLTFDDMAAREKNWAAFVSDPEWKKLSAAPGFSDAEIVSNISNTFLRPAPFSQI